MVAGKLGGLFGAFFLQRRHSQLHILCPAAIGDQHRIGCGHDDRVFQANTNEFQPVSLRSEQRIFTIDRGRRSTGHDTCPTFTPDRVPATKIAPGTGEGDNRKVVGLFHHRIIDGDINRLTPGIFGHAEEGQITLQPVNSGLNRTDQLGGMDFKGGNDRLSREEKNARVPQEFATGEHLLCRGGIGLFHKAGQRRRAVFRGFGQFQIPIARLRPIRRDAKGDKTALFRCGAPHFDRVAEGVRVWDHMVRRRHQHKGFWISLGDMKRCSQYRWGRVAALGFNQNRTVFDTGLCKLFSDDKAEI